MTTLANCTCKDSADINCPWHNPASNDRPIRRPEPDGIYPHCVWCNGENYRPNVIPYSKGKSACHNCGKYLPKEYVKS